jgi:citrate/tricarballylate utilization protein
MPYDIPSLAEAQRQFLICSACRYCEGYCATFPAIEGRTEYTAADVAYIANICHDCRACSQACMYAAPHEFAVDIPKLLGTIRLETYGTRGNGRTTLGAGAAVLAVLLAALALAGRWGTLASTHAGPGAFYAVVPFLWMLIPALVLAVWGTFVLARAGAKLVRENAPGARDATRHWLGAIHDALALAYLRGGGDGCYYPEQEAPSSARRTFHIVLVAGVGLAFGATIAAAFMQDVLDLLPPYPLLSAPVVLGTLGGFAILAGAIGLLALKALPQAQSGAARGMTALDIAFLATLLVVAATGLALLALRGTAAVGVLLVVHLAAVAALFLTAPYGKFVHVPLRLAALFVFRVEESKR